MPKERISLTIERDILKRLDMLASSSGAESRSAAVEGILKKSLESQVPTTAVILCGGKGTRLRPITYEIPKVLMPVGGKALIDYHISALKNFGISNVVLAVGYLKDRIKEHFSAGRHSGVNIIYAEEEQPLGTAGPLRAVKNNLPHTFMVCNGDVLYNQLDLQKMFEVHRRNNALATISLAPVDDPSQYGVARLEGNRILEFVEKPKQPPSKLINAGVYIIEPEVLDMIPKGFSQIESDVFPKVAKMGRLFGFPFGGQWFDLGTIERYEQAIKQWKGMK